MKRKICLLTLALALTASLAACGNKTTEVNPSAPAVAPTNSTTPSAVPSDNVVSRGDNAWAGNDALDNAGDVIRGAVNGARDVTRGVIDGFDTAAEDMGKAAHDATNGVNRMTGPAQYGLDAAGMNSNNLW